MWSATIKNGQISCNVKRQSTIDFIGLICAWKEFFLDTDKNRLVDHCSDYCLQLYYHILKVTLRLYRTL